ncbi:hypothetical protein VTO42DRAFT_7510 [Malbranchea cinnamomea]
MEDMANTLVSAKSTDSGFHVLLHPLVLLNISDHITRHAVREQTGPIVGALLGQQQGRNISLEHVFECKVLTEGENTILDQSWFDTRLKQFKDVHKDPPLDLVGWFTVTPPTGPTPAQVPIHRQILENYNETAIFLGFHASGLENMASPVGKLPLTIFESLYEGDNADDGDRTMEIDGQQPTLSLRFRELPYSIETGEAEMIGVDFVASGSGNASAIPTQTDKQTTTDESKGKKKRKDATEPEEAAIKEDTLPLSREDEDLIANLTTRLSAVKVLGSRLKLIQAYLVQISQNSQSRSSDPSAPRPSHTLLRSIYSLLAHLFVINPGTTDEFASESLAQANDVALVGLLGSLGESVQQMRELGRKWAVTSSVRRKNASQEMHMMMQKQLTEDALHGTRRESHASVWR